MEKILNKVNNYLNTSFSSFNEFISKHNTLINDNKLQMFVSCKDKEKLVNLQNVLKSNNLIVLGNINCPIEEYENNIEDDGFELELDFNGKYEFKVLDIGYDAIAKLYFFYFYPTNKEIKLLSDFYNKILINFISDDQIDFLVIDDYGYVSTNEDKKPLSIDINIDFNSIEDLVNSVYLLLQITNSLNNQFELNINYINE